MESKKSDRLEPPPGVHVPKKDGRPEAFDEKPTKKPSVWSKLKKLTEPEVRRKVQQDVKRSVPSKAHFLADTLSIFRALIKIVAAVFGPVFSALSIWVSVFGIAFTLFSGVEPFIQVAHWARYLTVQWRNLTHRVWDMLGPYIGFEIPIDLKDFATFAMMLLLALILGIFSNGKKLVVYDSIVGIRMAIYGIAHAINITRHKGDPTPQKSVLQMLFFEINNYLGHHLRSFLTYSLPCLVLVNIAFRVAIIFIPMIILVPESAFEEHLGVRATRVEYLFLSAVFSYLAAFLLLSSGVAHLIFHFIRATIIFLRGMFGAGLEDPNSDVLGRMKSSWRQAKFGVSFHSKDEIRMLWNDQLFLARISAMLIRTNWVWFPISVDEKFHRKYDFFLKLSERRFADPAFLDRITKGLFLFFIIYALNWVSINADSIANMFAPPS